ncbi:phage baseplate assembly protein V [Methylobacterium planeticum]|uniref:Phage baseplate assembly protein V n=1 Tax=Methylobacterium planeticum TaxID=2615211 RepID=A0A6N6MEQ4_9HYPH|nr:phage baseplate assembly protein V [Methylobacterium planeticum]KAB1069257.1 hypothetical protein F6X51_25625 [Methylobacterium planeticum]
MSDFDDLLREVIRLGQRLAEVEHKNANMLRVGTVEQVDGKKGYQVKFAEEDGKAVPSPWFPHPEEGGTAKSWKPMPKGQIVFAICPDGDPRQGFLVPKGGFSDQNKAPSENLEEHVETYGDKFKKVTNKDGVTYSWGDKTSYKFGKDGIVHTVDGVSHTITKDGIIQKTSGASIELASAGTTFKAGGLKHDDRNIGKNHVHGGVMPGAGKTGDPDA